MLEGMANHQARAVQARAGGLLLYAPVVRAEDFHSAIAYLVRRLDENTAPENFLRHVFDLEPGSREWTAERDRFLAAFERTAADCPMRRAGPRTGTSRRAPRARAVRAAEAKFDNEPDTDWTLAANRAWIERVVRDWQARPRRRSRSRSAATSRLERGRRKDSIPRVPDRLAYRFALADRADVDRALTAALARAAGVGRARGRRRAARGSRRARPSSGAGAAT